MFINCAINSLFAQNHTEWELIIIDDGSTDNLEEIIEQYSGDIRIRFFCNRKNEGLGYCLNKGIMLASCDLIAYLPADDIYFNNHLESLVELQISTNSDLVYSGIVYNTENIGGESASCKSEGKIEDYPLQLVQVLHKKTNERWLERKELVTNDLGRMFWDKFQNNARTVLCTKKITCEWIRHLYQRYNIINNRNGGGIYMYKTYYEVKECRLISKV